MLIVGGGPAGLECALTLGKRGYRVQLAEARRELGGRVTLESRLPGLSSWGRVRDYRLGQLGRLANVEIYPESQLAAADVAGIGLPPCGPGDRGRAGAATASAMPIRCRARSRARPASSRPTTFWTAACPTVACRDL